MSIACAREVPDLTQQSFLLYTFLYSFEMSTDAAEVASFLRAVSFLSGSGENVSSAAEFLLSLRSSSPERALGVARAVLSPSPDLLSAVASSARTLPVSARIQAALLLRDAGVRHWPMLTPAARSELRDSSLRMAADACTSGERALAATLTAATAVLWKRGWCSSDGTDPGVDAAGVAHLLATLTALFSAGGTHALLGANVCGALVQEFDLSCAGAGSAGAGNGEGRATARYTALGLPVTFHADAAAAFQEAALLPIFRLVCEQVVAAGARVSDRESVDALARTPAAAAALPLALLAVFCDALAWDFGGTRRGAALFRMSAGAWRALTALHTPATIVLPLPWQFALASNTAPRLLSAVGLLHDAARACALASPPCADLAQQARLAIAHMCALGELRESPPLAGAAPSPPTPTLPLTCAAAAMLAAALRAPLLDAPAAAAGTGDDAAHSVACAEARDLLVAASTLLSHDPGVVPRLLVAGASERSLQPLLAAAYAITHRLTGSVLAVAGSVSASAAPAVEAFLEGRGADVASALEAALAFWKIVCVQLAPVAEEQAWAAGTGASARGLLPSEHPDSAALVAMVTSAAAGAFEAIVRARVSLEAAIVRCGVNNDDPMEDSGAAGDLVEAAAALARFAPAESAAFILAELGTAFAQLQRIAAAAERSGAGGDLAADDAAACEALWWLIGYAAHFLADEPRGETPVVPERLNALSKASSRGRGGAAAAVSTAGAAGTAAVQSEARHEAIVAADPVARLVAAVATIALHEAGRLARAAASGRVPPSMSPLLYARLLWALGRLARTYILPDLQLYTSRALAPALAATGGADAVDSSALAVAAGGTGASSDGALLRVPVAPGVYGGGRALLELTLDCAASALASPWAGSEPDVASAAVSLIVEVGRGVVAARWCVVSPTWAAIADACRHICVSGRDSSSGPGSGGGLGRGLALCAPDALRRLLAALLAAAPFIGDEALAGLLPGASEELLRLAGLPAAEASAALAVAPPVAAAVLGRWRRFCEGFSEALRSRLSAVLGSAEFARAPDASTVADELERLLALHAGLLTGFDERLPAVWHISATAGALMACPLLVGGAAPMSATGGTGAVATGGGLRCALSALGYAREFVSPDRAILRRIDATAAEAVLSAVAALFRSFSVRYGPRLLALTAEAATAAAAAASAAAATAAAAARRAPRLHAAVTASSAASQSRLARLDEEELADCVRLQLDILERLLETEDTAFIFAPPAPPSVGDGGDGGFGDEGTSERRVAAAATHAVITGLSCLLPMLAPGSSLLLLPGLASSYVAVVSGLVCGYPQQVARMDVDTFSALLSALEFGAGAGAGSGDDELVDAALRAVQTLGSHHATARARGFAPPLDGLQAQVAALRMAGGQCLWARLLSIVLGVLVGVHPPSRSVLPTAADALGAVISADPQAYAAAVQALLAGHADANTARALASEFNVLSSDLTVDASSLKSRSGRIAFRSKVEQFVENVRKVTTVA